jgi:hypothetical protein
MRYVYSPTLLGGGENNGGFLRGGANHGRPGIVASVAGLKASCIMMRHSR